MVHVEFTPYPWKTADMIGGSPAVDFVNTASNWKDAAPGRGPVDRLDGASGFADWAEIAGLIDAAARAEIAREIARDPKAAGRLYARGRELRAALHGIFASLADGRSAAPGDLRRLSEWTRRAAQKSELAPANGAIARRFTDAASALERPLLMIATEAEKLLEEGPLDRLHRCDACEWLFVDRSKNARRRWCSMATCGNEAKVKKFRERKKTAA
jgi:predicted RNA-binding Zn ribbon-like protein